MRYGGQLCALVGLVLVLTGSAQVGEYAPPPFQSLVPDEPMSWGLYTFEGRSDLKESGTDAGPAWAQAQELDFVVLAPVFTNDAFTCLAGGAWRWNRFDLGGVLDERYDLYAASLPVNLFYHGLERWLAWFNIAPGIYSDLRHITGEDYRVTAHAMLQFECARSLQLALGAGYDREFGDDKLYPMGGLIWHPDPFWRVNLVFPIPQIIYAPAARWVCFVDLRPAGNKWNVHGEDDRPDYDFKLETWQIGVGTEYRIWKDFWLHGSLGADLERHYEIRNRERVELDSDANDTYFARVGLVVR